MAAVLWAGFALMVIIEDNPNHGKHGIHRAAQVRADAFVRGACVAPVRGRARVPISGRDIIAHLDGLARVVVMDCWPHAA